MNLLAAVAGFFAASDFPTFLLTLPLIFVLLIPALVVFGFALYNLVHGRNRRGTIQLLGSVLPVFVMLLTGLNADTLRFLFAYPGCLRAAGQSSTTEYRAIVNAGGFLDHMWQYRVMVAQPEEDQSHPLLPQKEVLMGYRYSKLQMRIGRCWMVLDSRFEGEGP